MLSRPVKSNPEIKKNGTENQDEGKEMFGKKRKKKKHWKTIEPALKKSD